MTAARALRHSALQARCGRDPGERGSVATAMHSFAWGRARDGALLRAQRGASFGVRAWKPVMLPAAGWVQECASAEGLWLLTIAGASCTRSSLLSAWTMNRAKSTRGVMSLRRRDRRRGGSRLSGPGRALLQAAAPRGERAHRPSRRHGGAGGSRTVRPDARDAAGGRALSESG